MNIWRSHQGFSKESPQPPFYFGKVLSWIKKKNLPFIIITPNEIFWPRSNSSDLKKYTFYCHRNVCHMFKKVDWTIFYHKLFSSKKRKVVTFSCPHICRCSCLLFYPASTFFVLVRMTFLAFNGKSTFNLLGQKKTQAWTNTNGVCFIQEWVGGPFWEFGKQSQGLE